MTANKDIMKFYRVDAIETAHEWIEENPVYLGTTTTGLGPAAEVIDLALIDYNGARLIDTLIKPTVAIEPVASDIHHITAETVADAPTFSDVFPDLIEKTKDRLIIVYNENFNSLILHQTAAAHNIEFYSLYSSSQCSMLLFAKYYGDWDDYRQSYKWKTLEFAGSYFGIKSHGLHRAAVDARLTLLVLQHMANTI